MTFSSMNFAVVSALTSRMGLASTQQARLSITTTTYLFDIDDMGKGSITSIDTVCHAYPGFTNRYAWLDFRGWWR